MHFVLNRGPIITGRQNTVPNTFFRVKTGEGREEDSDVLRERRKGGKRHERKSEGGEERLSRKRFFPRRGPQTFGPIITLISSTEETYCSVDASRSGCSPFFFFFFILCRYALYLLHCGKRVKRMSVPRTVHLSPSFPSPPPDPPSFVARVLFDFTRKTLDGSSSSRSSAYFRLERIITGFEMVEINSSRSVYFLHRNSGKLNSICLFYKYSNFWDI